MGTWGIQNFENDDAADWVSMLIEEEDPDLVILSLREIADEEDYIEAPECCEALCAIEIMAAIKQDNMEDLPEELQAWLMKMKVQEELAYSEKEYKLAKSVLSKILKDSELLELWEESDEFKAWMEIQKRLLIKLT